MSTRLMCTGDIHLGSGSEYGREPGERLREQADVWARIVELAVERNCDALLFAGDAMEGPLPTPEQYVAFAAPLAAHPDLPVLAIRGNGRHDSAKRDRNALEVFQAGYAHGSFVVHSTPGIHRFAD